MSEHACWVCTSTESRKRTADLLRRNPRASLKELADYAGTSKGQASSWRWYMKKRGCLGAQLPVPETLAPALRPLPVLFPIGTAWVGAETVRRA